MCVCVSIWSARVCVAFDCIKNIPIVHSLSLSPSPSFSLSLICISIFGASYKLGNTMAWDGRWYAHGANEA
uniref:Putative secreted protein n=1 Tax=Anopheles marajoara TaxID=58244 RepID=A0A2M4CFD0_9DIPT